MTPPPGSAAEPTPEWSGRVSELIDGITGEALAGVDLNGQAAPFYNPLSEQLEADEVPVTWSALSGTLRALDLPAERRWKLADEARLQPVEVAPGKSLFGQDEYCEWAVARNAAGEITEVTFTTEVGEWFEHLAQTDLPGLVAAYKDIFGVDVEEEELFSNGAYDWRNPWNLGVDGKIAHLAQENNTLGAAIRLAAEASVARTSDGKIVTDAGALMACNGLGDGDRFSDPSIATTINAAVVAGPGSRWRRRSAFTSPASAPRACACPPGTRVSTPPTSGIPSAAPTAASSAPVSRRPMAPSRSPRSSSTASRSSPGRSSPNASR